ncbi:MAG TPA: DNA repair protein RecO [Bacteroidia bacterium]|nr:DNA repair protein RecO [Bacteroidia bacterium]HNU32075.1 DNA repair protein RecO [Bacteroidia bacterium]
MLHKTKGIVLHATDYSESSIIAKIFTEQFGLQSYLVNSVRSKKAKSKSGMFQPCTMVDMVVYHKPEKGLQRISEANFAQQFKTIPYNVIKTTIALFFAEVVYKSVKEEESNANLFHFLETVLIFLDERDMPFANYPALFLIHLSKYLGSFPENNFNEQHPFFDLAEGRFVNEVKFPAQTLSQTESQGISTAIEMRFENFSAFNFTSNEKRQLLHNLISYYHLHHAHGSKIKSHLVLEEVFE